MQSELTIFKNEEFGEIRTKNVEGEPYFCLADVCRILEIGNPTDVKSRLKKGGVVSIEVTSEGLSQSKFARKTQKMTFINESNLYKTIFQSRKPEAEQFTDWITSEVLPSIRKTGKYELEQIAEIDWERTRIEGKIVRKDLTNGIEKLIEYAKDKGASDAVVFYYANITAEVQKSVVYISKIAKELKKNLRDCLSVKQLSFIMAFEEVVIRAIDKGIEEDIGYKEIYQKIKESCKTLSDLIGKSKPAKLTDNEFVQSLTKKELKRIEQTKELKLLTYNK